MKILKSILLVIVAFLLMFGACKTSNKSNPDAHAIYTQLPEHRRICVVPNDFLPSLKEQNVIPFSSFENEQVIKKKVFSEEEFYSFAREQNVQYFIVSSDMIEDKESVFPWIIDKNFKICPGDPDDSFENYYVLLVWDNSKNTYHFFKYLYGNE